MREPKTKVPRTGCATCRACGIKCDGALECSDGTSPKCNNCSRFKRKCQWDGLKLFWPRANDCRRTIVSKSPLPSDSIPTAGPISTARFVHMSYWDLEMYHSLNKSAPARNLSLIRMPTIWNPALLESPDRDLFEYFCHVASTSLTPFGHDATTIGKFLGRIALQGQTASAKAVLQALLAFSSLHRNGLQVQAIELKISALGSLAQGPRPSLDPKEAIQHIATGMMICSFEVHQSSCTSGQWTCYLGGVKTVIAASSTETMLQVYPDAAVLLDWVHYHDVLAHFSLLYWKRGGAPELPPTPQGLFSPQTSSLPPPIFCMLNVLSQVCEAVSNRAISTDTTQDLIDHKGFLKVMHWRVRSLPIPAIQDDYHGFSDDATLLMQLYQLALLVYLGRSSEGLVDQPTTTQANVDKALEIFSRLGSCTQQFPIHIIGCEARTDEQRAIILDVIFRTEKLNSSRSFNYCQRIIQAIWAQDDLACGNKISYRDKVTSIMRQCRVVPTWI